MYRASCGVGGGKNIGIERRSQENQEENGKRTCHPRYSEPASFDREQ